MRGCSPAELSLRAVRRGAVAGRQLRNSLLHDFSVDDDGPLVATGSTRSAALKGAGRSWRPRDLGASADTGDAGGRVGQPACDDTRLLQLLPQLLPPFPKSLQDRQQIGPSPASSAGHGPVLMAEDGGFEPPEGLAPNTLSNCVDRCRRVSADVYLRRSAPVGRQDRRPSTPTSKKELLPKLLPAPATRAEGRNRGQIHRVTSRASRIGLQGSTGSQASATSERWVSLGELASPAEPAALNDSRSLLPDDGAVGCARTADRAMTVAKGHRE